ncbi:MAG: right-handed parallel beta-helix repeat-containing protein, partial [Verrucomicrobiota bacterium]
MSADTLLPPRRLSISTFARVVLTLTIFATTSRADLILNLTGSVGSNVINYEASGSVTVTRAVTSTISGLGLAPLAPSAGTTAAWISTFDNDLGDILNDAMNTSLNDDLALSNGGVSYRRNGVQFGILDLIDFDGSATLGGDDVELDTLGSVNYPALVAGDIVSWTGSGTFTLEDGETWETLFNTATTSVQSFSNPIDGGNYTVNIQTIQTILPAPTCEPLDFIGDNVDVNFTFSNNLVAETGTPPFPRNRNVNATGAADVSVQIGIPGTENNGNAGLTLDLDIQQERIRVQGFGSAGATATWTYTITNLDAPSFPGGLPVAFVASGTGNYTLDSATTNSITISGDQDSGHIIVHFLTDTFVDAAADYTITNDVAPVGIVPSAGDTVTWNGTNGGPVAGLIFGTNAFTTVQAAVNAAEEGCTVHIADGTYQQGAEIFVTKSLTLQGDGSISTTLDGNNAYRVIDLPNSPIDVILDGLTVTHGDPGNAPGGGIRNQGATLTISNSTISGNSATAGGGIRNQGILTISNSTISENLGFSGGGGVNNSGTLTATQCTFSGNNGGAPVGAGGGILSNGTFFLSQCTVMGNFAAAGGGINRSGGSATIYNSIIAGNTAASSGPDVIGTFTSNGKNFIGDKSDSTGFAADLTFSTGQTIADLLDVNLADNGGPTLTHALLPGSPAIDAGNNADIPADALDLDGDFDTTEAAPFDQRGGGFPRLLDGDSNGSSLVDIGAIEFLCDTYVDQAGDYTITNDVAPAGISSGDTVTWNGTSGGPVPNLIFGTSAFDSVQAAVDAAGDGCTVHIADGTYQEGAQIDVAKSLTLQGDGDISTTLDGNNAYRVIDLPNSPIDVVLDGLTITRGRPAAGSGGGIRNRGATLKISNATISDSGGGIYNQNSGTVSISNTTISDNTGIQGGGILNTNNGTVTIFNSTISGNSATGGFGGGGIYNENNGVVSVFNSTISGNSTLISAINGGGGILTAAGGGLTLAHCTITGNSTPVSGGGIRRLAGPATIHNCIIAGNTASFSGPDVFGTFTSSGSNFIGDPSGSGSFGSDLTFGTTSTTIADLLDVNLADNGGPTLTHSLISGSPAIDTGNNADIPADTLDIDGDMDTTEAAPYDQRGSGFPRLLDGDSNGSSLVDIGAIEFLCDTYVDQAGDYTIDVNHGATPLPTPGDIVTWKPGTPDEVTGLTFGVNAFDSVQDAIDAAGDGCTVFIADGTFQESAEITINKDLTLQGDGSNMTDIDGANSRRVINIGAGGHSITFRDIQVSNGTNSSGNGSGVLLGANSSLTLLGCDVNANKANGLGNGAGVYVDNGASLTAVNTIFRKNNATNSGGGIYNLGGTVDITNATFFDNRATFQTGAAIYNDTATASVTLSSCTLSRNERKPALFNNLGSITLNNTIVAGNGVGLPSLPPSVDVEGAFISNGSNFIGDPTGATGFGSDMTFANTGTVLSDLIGLLISGSSTFYFPLAADSPALEMGNNSDLPADAFDVDGDFDTTEALPTDQRGVGFPRIEGINTDIGAFEGLFNDTILVTTDLDEDNGDPDPNTGNGTSLREAINFANSLPGLQTIEFSTAPGSPFADDFADFVFVDSGQIVISDSIEIIGPGASKLTLDGGNNNRIFRIDGTPPLNVLIEGLRFQGGYANGPGEDGYGGAIYVGGVGTALGIDVDLKDVEFVNNSALKGGGFAFSDAIGTLTVEGCLFEGNYATTEAGGLAFYSGQQFLCSNSTYTNNATDGDAGGLMLTAFTNLRNVTVAGNIADANSDGGGSDIAGGICIGATTTVIANNCLIAGNTRTQDMPFDFDDIQGNNITSPSHNFVSDPGSAGGIMHGTSGNIVGDGSGGIVPPNQVFLTTGFDDFYPEIQDNGGVTGTLSLVQNSPAIDNASPSLLAGLST